MKYEIKEVVKGTESEKTYEEYIIHCKPASWWMPHDLKDYKVIAGKEGLPDNERASLETKDFERVDIPSLVDNYGVARFHSLKDVEKWLNDIGVYVTVGSGDYVIFFPGINCCRYVPSIDKTSIYLERRIINKKQDFVLLTQMEETPEHGQERQLKPKGGK